MTGSINFLQQLGESFAREFHAKSTSGQSIDLSNVTSLKFTELLEKLRGVIKLIQISMKEKARL
jgi:hypothetical protein